MSRRRIHGHERRLQRLGIGGLAPRVDRLQSLGNRRLGGLLHGHVDRGVDAQPALVDALPAEPVHELAAHLLLEVEPERFVGVQTVAHDQSFRPGRVARLTHR